MATPVKLGPWPGGVNLTDLPGSVRPDELMYGLNLRTDIVGNVFKRPGFKTIGAKANKINGDALVNLLVKYYRSDGTEKLIAAVGGKLFIVNETTGAGIQININGSGAQTMEATNLCSWFVYKDRLYILDGVKPQRYNSTDDLYAGHFIHVVTGWTLTPGGAGNLTQLATYKYLMTSVQGDMGEGLASAEKSITLTGVQDDVTLSTLDVAPATNEQSAKFLYRTKANGSVFYFLTSLAPAATSFVDGVADTLLGSELVAVHSPKTTARFAILGHDERTYWFGMSGIESSLVDVSDVGFPDRIPNTDFFTVNNNDGDQLTGGGKVPGGVFFLKKNSCWLLRAYGSGLINISPKIGSIAPWATREVPGGVIFVSQNSEIYFFDGNSLTEIGRNVKTEFVEQTESASNRMVSAYHDRRFIIGYDYKGTTSYNHRVLEYDLVKRKWDGPHENAKLITPSYFAVYDSVKDKGELVWGEARAAAGSYVYLRNANTLTDDGVKFLSLAKTGEVPILGSTEKLFYKVFGKGKTDCPIVVSVILDDGVAKVEATIFVTLAVPAGVLVWGEGNWGEKNWGSAGGSQVGEDTFAPDARVRKPRFEISDGGAGTTVGLESLEVLARALALK